MSKVQKITEKNTLELIRN